MDRPDGPRGRLHAAPPRPGFEAGEGAVEADGPTVVLRLSDGQGLSDWDVVGRADRAGRPHRRWVARTRAKLWETGAHRGSSASSGLRAADPGRPRRRAPPRGSWRARMPPPPADAPPDYDHEAALGPRDDVVRGAGLG